MSRNKVITLLFVLLKITVCIFGQKKHADIYYLKNHVLGLSEELKVDAVEEDRYFTGGKDVKHWLKLPSVSLLYLIGIKDAGLSLITISKKFSTPFYQAVEKQIDVGENITSTIAFKSFNTQLKNLEDVVMVSTASEKNEIILYKIQNFKLAQIWSWKRYAKVQTLLHFTVMREDRIFILDSDGITGYLYKFSIDNNSVHIRELEVLHFAERVMNIATSVSFPEPYLYAVKNGKLTIFKYTRFCPKSWTGEFLEQATLDGLGVNNVIPFQSKGKEYLAIAGRLGGILRVDATEKVVQELEIENVMEWLIIYTGPEKENTLLFCKTLENGIFIFYNTGFGWKTHENPPCYKYDNEHKNRIETNLDLGCLKEKKWSGAVSLELGQLPTLIFSQRKYIGEMYHIMVNIKRHILSMEELPEEDTDYGNYLSKMRSGLKNLVGGIASEKELDSTCSIVNMLTDIEEIAASAKEKVSYSCPVRQSIPEKRVASLIKTNQKSNLSEEVNKLENVSWPQGEIENGNNIEANSKVFHPNIHPISPDLETKGSVQEIQKQQLPGGWIFSVLFGNFCGIGTRHFYDWFSKEKGRYYIMVSYNPKTIPEMVVQKICDIK